MDKLPTHRIVADSFGWTLRREIRQRTLLRVWKAMRSRTAGKVGLWGKKKAVVLRRSMRLSVQLLPTTKGYSISFSIARLLEEHGDAFFLRYTVWIYQEQGEVLYNSKKYLASRRYICDLQDNLLTARLENSSLFHLIDCGLLTNASFEHFSGQDTYSGKFFIGPLALEELMASCGTE